MSILLLLCCHLQTFSWFPIITCCIACNVPFCLFGLLPDFIFGWPPLFSFQISALELRGSGDSAEQMRQGCFSPKIFKHLQLPQLIKIAIYCPQGSGTLRQKLTNLYFLALSCTILHYLALSRTILHYIALSCTILLCLALSYTIMHYLALPCTILHYLALSRTISHYLALSCNFSHYLEHKVYM